MIWNGTTNEEAEEVYYGALGLCTESEYQRIGFQTIMHDLCEIW